MTDVRFEALPLSVTVSGLKDGRATLRTPSGHEFHWPAEALPADCRPGDDLRIEYEKLHSIRLEDHERTRMGRALLNELLAAPPS